MPADSSINPIGRTPRSNGDCRDQLTTGKYVKANTVIEGCRRYGQEKTTHERNSHWVWTMGFFSPSFYMENIDDNCQFYDSQYANMTLNVTCIEEYFGAENN